MNKSILKIIGNKNTTTLNGITFNVNQRDVKYIKQIIGAHVTNTKQKIDIIMFDLRLYTAQLFIPMVTQYHFGRFCIDTTNFNPLNKDNVNFMAKLVRSSSFDQLFITVDEQYSVPAFGLCAPPIKKSKNHYQDIAIALNAIIDAAGSINKKPFSLTIVGSYFDNKPALPEISLSNQCIVDVQFHQISYDWNYLEETIPSANENIRRLYFKNCNIEFNNEYDAAINSPRKDLDIVCIPKNAKWLDGLIQ